MRGRVLEGLWFGSCKFILIICLQLRPVCTVCLQSGAINVIVRGCSWLRCLSYFSLPGFKWALCWISFPVFLISKCKCIPWFVSASVYTPFFFFIFLVFPGSNAKNKGSLSEWDVSSDLCQRRWSLRGKTVWSYPERAIEHTSLKKNPKKRWLPSPSDHVASVLLNLVFILSKLRKKNSLPHLKIWMLLVNLFDLIRAPREGLFLLIEGVYMLRAHNIPYYWYCQCVCHSAAITSFMGHGKQTVTMFHHGDGPLDCATQIVGVIRDRTWGRFPSKTNEKHTSIKGESHLMFLAKTSFHFQLT